MSRPFQKQRGPQQLPKFPKLMKPEVARVVTTRVVPFPDRRVIIHQDGEELLGKTKYVELGPITIVFDSAICCSHDFQLDGKPRDGAEPKKCKTCGATGLFEKGRLVEYETVIGRNIRDFQ